jgi:hypothetical protein
LALPGIFAAVAQRHGRAASAVGPQAPTGGTADGRYRRDRGYHASAATAIEEGRDLSSIGGILAGTACRLLLA